MCNDMSGLGGGGVFRDELVQIGRVTKIGAPF